MKNFALSLFLFLCFSLGAQDLEWNPEFSMQFKSIGGTDISPDGKYVAYTLREPVMEGEQSEYLTQIWVASSDGSMNIQYTRADKSSTSPAFSPNGEHIAFLSSRSGKNQVWVMRLMGGEAEQITNSTTGVGAFQWSPNGQTIAFTSRNEASKEEKEAKKEKRFVIEVDKNFKYNHLYTIAFAKDEEDNRTVQRLTSGDFNIGSFDWSPDGKTIVFDHREDPKINTGFIGGDISVVPADSGEVKVLVKRAGNDNSPKYSPDGKYIAFTSSGGQPEPIGLADLYLIKSEGGEPMAVAHTPDRSAGLWGWTKDGNNLIFAEALKTSNMAMSIYVGDVMRGQESMSKAKPLCPADGTNSAYDYNPSTGQFAFVYQNPNEPAELYISDMKTAVMPITKIHKDIELPAMGKTEVIKWTSKDGMEIEGLLTYPVDYEEGKAYPGILQIHGGPAGVFTKSFTGNPSIYNTQYFASKGFFVLRPNPRGSRGYGKEFRYANFKDWGYGDYEDLMSGMDKLIEEGKVDEDKQVAMGWSYGGYMTSFLVTKTDRFKAASMGAGLPNLISMVTTTDIPDYLVGHMGGEFWNDYETYEKHSAMYRIKNVKTPTQVIHGANDLRVPFTQGQEFYVALQRLGVDTEMLVLPRTPHGPREPKLLMQVSPRIMGWFEKYLKEVKP